MNRNDSSLEYRKGITSNNKCGHVANYYKFNLGRSALKIKPGEAFNGSINWPVALATSMQGGGATGISTLNSIYSQTPLGSGADPAGYWLRNSLIGLPGSCTFCKNNTHGAIAA